MMTGENRSLNNVKGDAELSALKALGFVLDYNGYSIEAGIKMHSEGRLPSGRVGTYGLQEVQQRNGRPLLYLSKPAARKLFGVKSYTDPKLWQKHGVICQRAKTVPAEGLRKAIDFLGQSLKRRGKGGDSGHDHMRALIQECLSNLEEESLAVRLGCLTMTR
jgi:hypothetical protein